VIQQEFGSMTNPNRFEQSLEIFIVTYKVRASTVDQKKVKVVLNMRAMSSLLNTVCAKKR
jgi:hypothetical protein